jgi:acyl carrier protein
MFDAVSGPAGVSDAVKRVVIAESRLSIDPSRIRDDEPLNGSLLRVSSLGFLGMLMRLEDECGLRLPDDLFVGRSFRTVRDLIDVITVAAGPAGVTP